jgi:hypothetical protein
MAGSSVCDDNLFGGCQHEFFAAAVEDGGIARVAQLNSDCVSNFEGSRSVTCQHGIGHGLISYFGYDQKGLTDSLTECAQLQSIDQTRGCMGGAYMEYNLRLMAGNTIRPFDAAKPYAPCDSVAQEFKSACYFWLPHWWREVVYQSERTTRTYAGMGAYCAALPTSLATSCFSGLGYIAGPDGEFNHTKVRALCDAVSVKKTFTDACWSEASSYTLQ